MKTHHYRFEIFEVPAMNDFEALVNQTNEKGEVTATLSEEKQLEVRELLEGKVYIKCIMEDVSYEKTLVLHSEPGAPKNVGYLINQTISKANKKIAKLIHIKEQPEGGIIINGSES